MVNEHLCPENEMLRLPRIPSFHHAEYNEMIHERYFKMMETRTNDNWTDKVRMSACVDVFTAAEEEYFI